MNKAEPLHKRKFKRRLTGYIKVPKVLCMTWISTGISRSAFSFYISLLTQTGFDKRNANYCIVDFNTSQLADLFSVTPSSINNWKKELVSINAIKETKDGYIEINNYEELIQKARTTFSKDKDNVLILNNFFDLPKQNFEEDSKKNEGEEKKFDNTNPDSTSTKGKEGAHNIKSYKGYKRYVNTNSHSTSVMRTETKYKELAKKYNTTIKNLKLMEKAISESTPVDRKSGEL